MPIELPADVVEAKETAQQLGEQAQGYVASLPSIVDVLKQKITEAYAGNKDIIEHLDQSIAEYLSSPAVAREQYQNIWNPFARESLVSQYTTNKAVPMMTNAGLLGQRMGRIEDTIGAGVRGYESLTKAAQAKADQARQYYEDTLSEFNLLETLKRQGEEMQLARDKFAWEKAQPKTGAKKSTDVVEIGGRIKLIDTQTGEVIQDLGEASVNTSVVEVGGRKKLINTLTGDVIQDLGEVKVTKEEDDRPWYKKILGMY